MEIIKKNIPLFLEVYQNKSQGLTLQKAIIDLRKNEFAVRLSFVAVSRICALKDLIFNPFSFERLQKNV